MSNPGQPPDGWDDQPDPDVVNGAREIRQMWLAFQVAGMSKAEANGIIGAWLSANMTHVTSSVPGGGG